MTDPADQGGDPACLAVRICPDCGAVLGEDPHRPDCPSAGEERAD